MAMGALTLGLRPPARAHLHTKVRNGLASVSTPSVLQHGTGPLATAHLGEVCRGQSTDANEMTRAHARIRNVSWMT